MQGIEGLTLGRYELRRCVAQLVRGDIYGLVFRLSPVRREFYVLELNSLGEYRFVRASGNDPLQWLTLIDWTHSNAILSGYGQINAFLIVAKWSQFRFYINQQLIITNFSDSFFSSGLIGFLVGGIAPGEVRLFSGMCGCFRSEEGTGNQ